MSSCFEVKRVKVVCFLKLPSAFLLVDPFSSRCHVFVGRSEIQVGFVFCCTVTQISSRSGPIGICSQNVRFSCSFFKAIRSEGKNIFDCKTKIAAASFSVCKFDESFLPYCTVTENDGLGLSLSFSFVPCSRICWILWRAGRAFWSLPGFQLAVVQNSTKTEKGKVAMVQSGERSLFDSFLFFFLFHKMLSFKCFVFVCSVCFLLRFVVFHFLRCNNGQLLHK